VATIDEFLYSSQFKNAGILFDNLEMYEKDILGQFFESEFCDYMKQTTTYVHHISNEWCRRIYGNETFQQILISHFLTVKTSAHEYQLGLHEFGHRDS